MTYTVRWITSFGVLWIATAVFAQTPGPQSKGGETMENSSKCPVMGAVSGSQRHTVAGAMSNRDRWPSHVSPALEQRTIRSRWDRTKGPNRISLVP